MTTRKAVEAQQDTTVSVAIPKTREAMKNQLVSLGLAIQAGEWQRAAFVFAFTAPGKAGRPAKGNTGRTTRKMSFEEFAKLGIVGLRTRKTVALYWKIWNDSPSTLKVGVEPGETVQLPDEDEHPWADAYREALGVKDLPSVPGDPEQEAPAEAPSTTESDESAAEAPEAPSRTRKVVEALRAFRTEDLVALSAEELDELQLAAADLIEKIQAARPADTIAA